MILLSLLLASCGETSNVEQTDETTAETAAAEIETETPESETESESVNLSDVPDELDFDGANYVVASRTTCTSVNAEELTGEGVNDSVYERNRLAEDYLNIVVSEEHAADKLDTAIKAGDRTYSSAVSHITLMTQYALKGSLINANDVAYLDLSKPYWAQGVTESLSVSNKPFLFSGDISITDNTNIWCVYFNKDMNAQLGKESPYKALDEGRWTLDYFSSALNDVAQDLDGNGVLEWDKDRYALLNIRETLCGFYNSCGQKGIELDKDGVMSFHLDSERSLDVMERISTMASTGYETTILEASQIKSGNDPWDELRGVFTDGRALYYTHTVNITGYMREMEEEYGILPIPKLDEAQQEYLSSTQEWGQCVYCIPVCCADVEMAGAALEYIASLSTDTIRAAYYDVALARKYTRDNESVEVLDILFNNIVIDPAFGFDFAGCQGTVSSAMSKSGKVASTIAKIASKVQTKMEEAQAKFDAME